MRTVKDFGILLVTLAKKNKQTNKQAKKKKERRKTNSILFNNRLDSCLKIDSSIKITYATNDVMKFAIECKHDI